MNLSPPALQQEAAQPQGELRLSLDQCGALIETLPLPVLVLRREDEVVRLANTVACTRFSCPGKPFVGQSSLALGLWSSPAAWAQLLEALDSAGPLLRQPFSLTDDVGGLHSGLVNASALRLDEEPCVLLVFDEPSLQDFENQVHEQQTRLRCRLESQKMEAIGHLSSSLAHDFNNILAAIILRLELLGIEAGSSEAVSQAVAELGAETKRAAAITRQLLLFSRRESALRQPIDLNEVIDLCSASLRALAPPPCQLSLSKNEGPVWIDGDPALLQQALAQLITNAREASCPSGNITVRLGLVQLPDTHPHKPVGQRHKWHACLMVADQGHGMDENTRQRIFEPFFTTKPQNKSAGLGLPMVYGILRQHDGWIEVDSKPGRGTVFTLYIPTLNAPPRPPQGNPSGLPREACTLLFIEDDPNVRRLSSLLLRQKGHTVLEAASGREALSLWRSHHARIKLVITDLILPDGLIGPDLLQEFRRSHPSLPFVLISGFDTTESSGIELPEDCNFLPSPFTPQRLLSTVAQALDCTCP